MPLPSPPLRHTSEQALIGALAARYPNAQPLDPSNEGPILSAYAAAMQGVAGRFPDDSDVQTLTAEALMNVNAWKLWSPDGTPAAGTAEIMSRLQGVLARDPRHPGANHYYIHTMEASPHPEAAVISAERLPGMMPAAGHLEHMPAHILQRVGRYAEAAKANRNGAAADLAYFGKTRPLDYYAMYTAHNYQFLAFSTAMQGRRAEDARRRAEIPGDHFRRAADHDGGHRLVRRRDIRHDGPLRHVAGYAGRTCAEPGPDRVDRRLPLRPDQRPCGHGTRRCGPIRTWWNWRDVPPVPLPTTVRA